MNHHPSHAEIFPAAEADLPALAELAAVIWHSYYPQIISREQIEFMLAQTYALPTLRAEIRSEGIRYYRLLTDGRFTGFASIGPTGAADLMKLHKLYLLPEFFGRGLGSRLLQHCEAEMRRLGALTATLNVNKRNARAITAYERNGFHIARSVVLDVGGGFVMDDYVMTKDLLP